MITEVEDLRGVFVKGGDTIAYAATDGRSGGLRVGTVLEIVQPGDSFQSWDKEKEYPTKQPTKIRVEVSASSGYWAPGKPTLIQASFKRFVRIAEAPPAPPVPKTREEMAAFAKDWDAKVEAGRSGS